MEVCAISYSDDWKCRQTGPDESPMIECGSVNDEIRCPEGFVAFKDDCSSAFACVPKESFWKIESDVAVSRAKVSFEDVIQEDSYKLDLAYFSGRNYEIMETEDLVFLYNEIAQGLAKKGILVVEAAVGFGNDSGEVSHLRLYDNITGVMCSYDKHVMQGRVQGMLEDLTARILRERDLLLCRSVF